MDIRRRVITALLIGGVAAALSGCGERAAETEKQTEKQTQAPVQTEAATEAAEEVTEAIVVIQTEAPTEAVTEAVTEKMTEARVLTSDEEAAEESELTDSKTYYAVDDINVRETPDTDTQDNIISSYEQGDEVTVTGETPNWYKVSKDGMEGYVYKTFLSETAVDPKTDEERAAAYEQLAEQAEQSDQSGSSASSSDNSDVNAYAESFSILIADDANLRASAAENADVIDVIPANTTVTALGETGNWYQVDYNGTIGYVSKGLVG